MNRRPAPSFVFLLMIGLGVPTDLAVAPPVEHDPTPSLTEAVSRPESIPSVRRKANRRSINSPRVETCSDLLVDSDAFDRIAHRGPFDAFIAPESDRTRLAISISDSESSVDPFENTRSLARLCRRRC